MKITEKKIDELAHLSRLQFDEKDKVRIQEDLERILGFCQKLDNLDTSNVEPLVYISNRKEHLREDIVKPSLSKADALLNAPDGDSDYFRVPKVIKK